MSYQTLEALERRKRIIRIILFLIILSTTPFYCAGFLLWGTARPEGAEDRATIATSTPIGGNLTPTRQPTLTALPLTITVLAPLQPTPLQFIPINPGGGTGGGTSPTQIFVQPTIFIPTATLAPTLTPFPTNAPPATQTPLPTDAPLPTNTPEPLPTEAPLPTETLLPTSTPEPLPTDETVVEPPPADGGTTP
jgi:hypothetical protein